MDARQNLTTHPVLDDEAVFFGVKRGETREGELAGKQGFEP